MVLCGCIPCWRHRRAQQRGTDPLLHAAGGAVDTGVKHAESSQTPQIKVQGLSNVQDLQEALVQEVEATTTLTLQKLQGKSPLSRPKDVPGLFKEVDIDGDGVLGLEDLRQYLGRYHGYGDAEIVRFYSASACKASAGGAAAGVTLEVFTKNLSTVNPYRIQKHRDGLFVRKPGAFGGCRSVCVQLADMKSCTVLIMDASASVMIDELDDCHVLVGPCSSSVFVRDCRNCSFWIASQQLRTRGCDDCTFHLHSKTEPVIESSTGLWFAPFAAAYPGLLAQFQEAGFDAKHNLWSAIHDFTPPSGSGTTNWSVLHLDRCEALTVTLPGGGSPESPSPPVTNELLCAPPVKPNRQGSAGTPVATSSAPHRSPRTPPAPGPGEYGQGGRTRSVDADAADEQRLGRAEGSRRVSPRVTPAGPSSGLVARAQEQNVAEGLNGTPALPAVAATVATASRDKPAGGSTARPKVGDASDARVAAPALGNACLACGKTGASLLRCGRCKLANFCSVECQKKAWPTHKEHCSRASKLPASSEQGPAPPAQEVSAASACARDDAESNALRLIQKAQDTGVAHIHAGRYREAKEAFLRMRNIAQEAQLTQKEASSWRLLGVALDKLLAPTTEVEECFQAALKMAHKADDLELTFDTLIAMGSHATRLGSLDDTEHLCTQALVLAKRALTSKQERLAEGNLAACFARKGRFDESMEHFRRAEQLYSGHSDSAHSLAALYTNYASTLAAMDRESEAVESYLKAIKVSKSIGDGRVQMSCWVNLANIYDGALANPARARECRAELAKLTAAAGAGDRSTCAICLEDIDPPDPRDSRPVVVLACYHAYHQDCFERCGRRDCPQCRSPACGT